MRDLRTRISTPRFRCSRKEQGDSNDRLDGTTSPPVWRTVRRLDCEEGVRMDRGSTLVFSIVFLTLTVLSSMPALAAESHVANFSAGTSGTSGYEHFAFWIREDKKNEIIYSYGKDSKEVKVAHIGPGSQGNEPCFKVQFSNGYVLNLIRKVRPSWSQMMKEDIRRRFSGSTRGR